jgi:hypothetical protein
MKGLMLHSGAHSATREAVLAIPTPPATPTWRPVPHGDLLAGVQATLERSGLHTAEEAHGLTRDGLRYFGLLRLHNGTAGDGGDGGAGDFGLVVGVRNSHDKSFPAGLVVGASVFVCDNLSFSGEVKLARKHTVHIGRDLPQLIEVAVGKIGALRASQARRFDAYRTTEFTDVQAHDLLIRAVDARVLPVTRIADALAEWRAPRHREFAAGGKTCWRLFNAVTEAVKGGLDALPKRTLALHGLLDTACGLVIPAAVEPAAAEPQQVTAG